MAAQRDGVQRLSDAELLDGLRGILPREHGAGLALVSRLPNSYTSTWPSEVVHLRSGAGELPRLFCKFQEACAPTGSHRRGIGYEARVYRELLSALDVTTPRFFGTWECGAVSCLAIEALEGATRVQRTGAAGMADAAAWLGRLHRLGEGPAQRAAFLQRYDTARLQPWIERARAVAREHRRDAPWLDALARHYESGVVALGATRATLLHGELYPMNVLCAGAAIHGIDWESAGVGPGEIDLAALCMGWPEDVRATCRAAYAHARWDAAAPTGFLARLNTARIYLSLRMLEDGKGAAKGDFFEYLHRVAVECGLEVQAS